MEKNTYAAQIHTLCGTLNMLRLSSENRISIEMLHLKSTIWHFGHFGCIFIFILFYFTIAIRICELGVVSISDASILFPNLHQMPLNCYKLFLFSVSYYVVSLDIFNCVVRIYFSNRIKWTQPMLKTKSNCVELD